MRTEAEHMIKLSLNKAAKEAGIAKSTLLEAIKKKRISAPKNDKGHYEIDPSELFRVFPRTTENHPTEPEPTTDKNNPKTSALEREIELLREMLDETKTDRDQWREQAQKITAMIEDKREKPKGFWAKLLG